jgi:hypothetical protein
MKRFAYLALISATSCAVDPASDVATGGVGGKADGPGASMTFAADFTETTHGSLLAGTSVHIDYDLARLQTCRAQSNNAEVWGVTGWAQFDNAAPVSFALSRLDAQHVVPQSADLELPASASHVAMWFTINNVWGCIAYDSNLGANYDFTIDRHGLGAVLAFDTDWSVSQSAALHAGDHVVVHYEPDRLSQCAGSTGGHPAWGVTAHWQVDGGTVHDLSVTRAETDFLVAGDPQLAIPNGHDLALWFEATSIWGCHAWDSAYGANYHFAIN